MEDVLEVYTRPYDPRHPQVCLDETSRQLLGEVNPPQPVAPGRPASQDYEYQRGGVCNLFLVCEPLAGWRDVMVSDRRTRIDRAHCIQDLADVRYPDAEQIVLVQDNLNTPATSSWPRSGPSPPETRCCSPRQPAASSNDSSRPPPPHPAGPRKPALRCHHAKPTCGGPSPAD